MAALILHSMFSWGEVWTSAAVSKHSHIMTSPPPCLTAGPSCFCCSAVSTLTCGGCESLRKEFRKGHGKAKYVWRSWSPSDPPVTSELPEKLLPSWIQLRMEELTCLRLQTYKRLKHLRLWRSEQLLMMMMMMMISSMRLQLSLLNPLGAGRGYLGLPTFFFF